MLIPQTPPKATTCFRLTAIHQTLAPSVTPVNPFSSSCCAPIHFMGFPPPPHPFPIISSFLFTLSIISWFLVIWKRESWNNWCSYSIGRRERLRGGVWEHGCLQQRVPVGAGLHVRHGAHVRLPGIVREERQRKEPRQCRHRQYGGHRHPQDHVWLPSNSHPPNSLAIFFVSFSSFIFLFWKMGFEATFLGFFETALLDFVGC